MSLSPEEQEKIEAIRRKAAEERFVAKYRERKNERMADTEEAEKRDKPSVSQILSGVVVLAVLFWVVSAPSCDSGSRSSAELSAPEWLQGGTLHSASLREWRDATYANKLATAADFIATTLNPSQQKALGLDGLRARASALLTCIDEVAYTSSSATEQAAAVGALCMRQLGYG